MPYNPYNTEGLSREVRSLITVVEMAGGIVTSTTDHPKFTKAGYLSNHRKPGTDGEGLALDAKDTNSTPTKAGLLHIYEWVVSRFGPFLTEAICGYAPTNIRQGREVEPYAVKDHLDHCHFAVAKGVFLDQLLPAPTPITPEDDVPKDKDFVDGCECWAPGCEGGFGLQYDGGVSTIGYHTDEHFRGSYFSFPESVRNDPNRRFYAMENVALRGYVLLGTDGSLYGPDFP